MLYFFQTVVFKYHRYIFLYRNRRSLWKCKQRKSQTPELSFVLCSNVRRECSKKLLFYGKKATEEETLSQIDKNLKTGQEEEEILFNTFTVDIALTSRHVELLK